MITRLESLEGHVVSFLNRIYFPSLALSTHEAYINYAQQCGKQISGYNKKSTDTYRNVESSLTDLQYFLTSLIDLLNRVKFNKENQNILGALIIDINTYLVYICLDFLSKYDTDQDKKYVDKICQLYPLLEKLYGFCSIEEKPDFQTLVPNIIKEHLQKSSTYETTNRLKKSTDHHPADYKHSSPAELKNPNISVDLEKFSGEILAVFKSIQSSVENESGQSGATALKLGLEILEKAKQLKQLAHNADTFLQDYVIDVIGLFGQNKKSSDKQSQLSSDTTHPYHSYQSKAMQ